METRTLTIWNGEDKDGWGRDIRVSDKYREEYNGHYLETYEASTVAMKSNSPERKGFRIGLIFDTVKNCVAVFKQVVTSRDDYIPTDIVIGFEGPKFGENVLEAWCTDPQHADSPSRYAKCTVRAFAEREPTEKEKRMFANIRQGPPTNADRQHYEKEQEDKKRRVKAEEALIQLAKLHAAPADVIRRELAPLVDVMKGFDRKVKAASAKKIVTLPPTPQYVFRREGESWEMVFEGGKVFHPQHRKGYEYIRELLAHPCHEYTAPELTGIVEKPLPANAAFQDGKDALAVTTGTRQCKMDKKAIAQTLTRLEELRANLNKPTISRVERQEIKDEIEMLKAHLKSNTFLGRAKTFSAQDGNERARITQLIQEARKAIGKSLPKLETHLKAIKTGHRFVYTGNTPFAL